MNKISRIRCWWRGYHRESPTIGRFRYDVSGYCCDCGKVGDGINHNDDPPPIPFAFGLSRKEVWRLVRGKMSQNPYDTLANDFIKSVVNGNQGKITGEIMGLPDRLREYAYYRQENAINAADGLLVNDLLTAAKQLSRMGIL